MKTYLGPDAVLGAVNVTSLTTYQIPLMKNTVIFHILNMNEPSILPKATQLAVAEPGSE